MKMKIIFLIVFMLSYSVYSEDLTSDKNNSVSSSISETSVQSSFSASSASNISPKKKDGYDLYIEGKFRESITSLLEEKKSFPDRINIYIIMGWDYKELKEYSEMERVSLEGAKYDPDHSGIIKNLGEAYFFQNKFNESIQYFQSYISKRNIKTDNYIQTAYYLMGMAFFNLGYYNKADAALSTVKYFQPSNFTLLINLAETKEKLLEFDKALILFNEALKLSPNNTKALDGIQRINNIKKQQ